MAKRERGMEREREDKVDCNLSTHLLMRISFLRAYTCKSRRALGCSFTGVDLSNLMLRQVSFLMISGTKVKFPLYTCAAWYASAANSIVVRWEYRLPVDIYCVYETSGFSIPLDLRII